MSQSADDETRFEFGENWARFLKTVDEDRIAQAEVSLRNLLGIDDLNGKSFFDIGSGSGLFSLAAHRLGARVVSIDYDAESVACTEEIKRRYASESDRWSVQRGSVLDQPFLESLGKFDVVYSWGVLHHTGQMNRAIELASESVCEGGQLAIAIYNDQGAASRRWFRIKKTYNALPKPLRVPWVILIAGYYELKFAAVRLLRFKNPLPFADWRAKKKDRGMSAWHDWVDWIGGMPFECGRPDDIIELLAKKRFRVVKLNAIGKGWGCNEYVFQRESNAV